MNSRFILTINMAIAVVMAGLLTNCNRQHNDGNIKCETGPVPVCHLHMGNSSEVSSGSLFFINGQWTPGIDYGDMDQISFVLNKIKDAGISVVCVDCHESEDWGMGTDCLDIISKACSNAGMEYFILLTPSHSPVIQDLNQAAGLIMERIATDKAYRHYGFGDDRPILTLSLSGTDFRNLVESASDDDKKHLDMFHIGTCQVNENQEIAETDGWGYHNMSESMDGSIRFCSPNSGVAPDNWARVDEQEWKRRIKWALGAKEYAVLGSYDDTQNALMWGICDVSHSRTPSHINPSTIDRPSIYYDILKNILINAEKD